MKLDFQLNEPNSPALRLEKSVWLSRSRLYVDNQEVPSDPKKGLFDQTQTFVVSLPDGSQRQLELKNRVYDPVPLVLVGGQPLELAEPLEIWEYIIAAMPLVLVFSGGLLGGAAGGFAAYLNMNIMRSVRNMVTRVLLSLGMLVVALLAYSLLAWLLSGALAG